MKRNLLLLAAMMLFALRADALIVSVQGHGDISEEGMEITVDEAEIDVLSGKTVMKVEGTLLATSPLTVTITRSSAQLSDEFCCAGECKSGNKETVETLNYTPQGIANWFVHYMPASFSNETVTYLFESGEEQRSLTVHYIYDSEGVETVSDRPKGVQKILRDGIVYIIKDDKIYHL